MAQPKIAEVGQPLQRFQDARHVISSEERRRRM